MFVLNDGEIEQLKRRGLLLGLLGPRSEEIHVEIGRADKGQNSCSASDCVRIEADSVGHHDPVEPNNP